MSNNVLIQVRVDDELKREVTEIYNELGLDIQTAIRMFLKKSRNVHGIPFETKLSEMEMARVLERNTSEAMGEQAIELQDMSLTEKNNK